MQIGQLMANLTDQLVTRNLSLALAVNGASYLADLSYMLLGFSPHCLKAPWRGRVPVLQTLVCV